MKKILKSIMMLSIASMAVLSSCKKDDETIADATVTITPSPTGAINAGEVLTLTIQASGNDDNKLSEITVTRTGRTTPIIDNKKITGTTHTEVVRDTPTTAGSITYTVTVKADKNTATQSYTVTVNTALTIETHNPTLGNQKDALPKFWSSINKQVYQLVDVANDPSLQARIDFGYASRSIAFGSNKLVSPASADATAIYSDQWSAANEKITTWATRNNTMFKMSATTTTAFDAANTTEAITALIAAARTADGEPNAPSLTVTNDKVVLFKTEAGRYGLIKIVDASGSVDGNGVASAGQAQLLVKYQK